MRKRAKQEAAAVLVARMKAVDYQLIGIVAGPNCPLTTRAADRLVRIQRAIRSLRYDIEVETGVEAPPMTVPRPAPGGSPELLVVSGDRRGDSSARFA